MIRQNRKRPAHKPGSWSIPRPLAYPLALALALCLLWLLAGTESPQSWSRYWSMTQELNRTKEAVASLEQANAALRKEIQHLESDPFTLETLARDRLGYVKEGETVYQFIDPIPPSPL